MKLTELHKLVIAVLVGAVVTFGVGAALINYKQAKQDAATKTLVDDTLKALNKSMTPPSTPLRTQNPSPAPVPSATETTEATASAPETVESYPKCHRCNGSGIYSLPCPCKTGRCRICNGTGKMPGITEEVCPFCNGDGKCPPPLGCGGDGVLSATCYLCRSTGHKLGTVRIGMTANQVTAAIGKPNSINTTVVEGLAAEQWVYGEWGGIDNKSVYVYVDNGKVSSFQF